MIGRAAYRYRPIGTQFLLVFRTVAILFLTGSFIHCGNGSPPSSAQSPTPAPTQTVASESVVVYFRVGDYLGRKPHGLADILGHETHRGECSDLRDGLQIEYERGYVCVQGGKVALLAFDLPQAPRSPEDGLRAVGISTNVAPQHPGGTAYLWSERGGNPLEVNNQLANRVIVNVGAAAPGVSVNIGRD